MRSLERHRDAGAYALGVLDEAEAFRFEDHLMDCPRCAAHVTGFGPTTRQLMLYRRATAPFVHPLAQPGPRLLDRLLGELAHHRRVRRRRLGYGLAASVVLAVAGPGIVAFAGHPEPPDTRATRAASATDPRTGVWARVTSADREWGGELRVEVAGGAGPPRTCRLVAVGRDGTEQVVAGWTGPGAGGGPTTALAATALRPDRIARYEVRTAEGKVLVTVPGR
ncbi:MULTISPECIES: zf-HC2 domain-containing protein [Streptomyces]|uniref:Zf-HC2 domain-containing protein n=1 Tax=Streptomyces eurythermus TaxID=42237 RepID=A0ABW6YRJ2_9ACTN|nr:MULTISPECIES: zf-HC2 domain-containing protein [Streptomyces]QIS74524.1 zf-HC2 domain-containing protein [Streptomyces sp. DSM 40868]WDM10548.1 zf-HC2 domain-containing protein [Streptomyces lavenduligriseus]